MGTRSRWRDAACFTCAKSRTDACRREVHLGLWYSRARCGDEAVRVYAQWPRCRVKAVALPKQRFIFPFPRVQKNQRREGRLRDTRCCHVRTHPARNFLSHLSHRPRKTSSELANWRIPNFRRTSSLLGNLFRCWLAETRDPTFRCRPLPNGAPQPAGAAPPPGG